MNTHLSKMNEVGKCYYCNGECNPSSQLCKGCIKGGEQSSYITTNNTKWMEIGNSFININCNIISMQKSDTNGENFITFVFTNGAQVNCKCKNDQHMNSLFNDLKKMLVYT